MRSKLIRNALFVGLCPIGVFALSGLMGGQGAVHGGVLIWGTLMQMVLILACKWDVRRLFAPSLDVLESMGVERVPAPCQPGKYKVDLRISETLIWAGTLTPVLGLLACAFPRTVTPMGIPALAYTGPDLTLMALAMVSSVVGGLALIFWAKVGQITVISDELNEGRRYLYRGFAELVDDPVQAQRYLKREKQLDTLNGKQFFHYGP